MESLGINQTEALQHKTCPVCEHWNNIIDNKEIGELKKSEARVALSTHQYFKHFKKEAKWLDLM